MSYPHGYQPAEHRRALEAMLADIFACPAAKNSTEPDRLRSASGAAPRIEPPRVIGARAAEGQCDVVLRIGPGAARATTGTTA